MNTVTNFQPLYRQVYDLLTARIVNGDWKPSENLPSEWALADELGVSQGTVRKALNQMVVENLLSRRQGKGTFVAEHTQESSLFRFFRYRQSLGDPLIPETRVVSVEREEANKNVALHLKIEVGEPVVKMLRVRSLLGIPTIIEKIFQPISIFPDIDKQSEIPNSLYTLYQEEYNISIVQVKDEVRATTIPDEFASYLNLDLGSPVLMVERASINIDGRTVEWSQSYSSSERFVYSVDHK